MTSDIDLRGKGLGARQGLGVKEHKINVSLERISELFDTGHQSLASNLLKNRNNTSLELKGLILAAERCSFFRMNEFRRWFSDLQSKESEFDQELLGLQFEAFLEYDLKVAFDTAALLFEKDFLYGDMRIKASETAIKYGDFQLGLNMLLDTENGSSSEDASRIAGIAARSFSIVEEQAKAWVNISNSLGVLEKDLQVAASKIYLAGMHEEVIELLGKISFETQNQRLIFILSKSLYNVGLYEECIDSCRHLLEINPGDSDALSLVIRSKKKLGDTRDEETIEALKKSLELGVIRPSEAYFLSRMMVESGDWELAGRALGILFEDEGGDVTDRHIVLKSKILSKLEGDASAKKWLASNDDESSVVISKALASLYHRLHEDELALGVRKRLLQLEPENTDIRRGICVSFLRLGRFDEALDESRSIIEVNPYDANAHEVLIETLFRIGKPDLARDAWADILALSMQTEQGTILGVEICLRFNWINRLDWILRSRIMVHDSDRLRYEIQLILIRAGRFDLSKRFISHLGAINEEADSIVGLFESDLGIDKGCIMDDPSTRYSHRETAILNVLLQYLPEKSLFKKRDNRVLILTSSLNVGGAERQVLLTAHGLEKIGWDVTVGVDKIDSQMSDETLIGMANSLGLTIEEFDTRRIENEEFEDFIARHDKVLSHLKPIEKRRVEHIVELILRIGPSVIHSWQDALIYPAAIACSITGASAHIGSVRSMNPNQKSPLHGRKRPFLRRSMQILSETASFELANNSHAGAESYSRWLDVPTENINIIWNGVQSSNEIGTDLKEELNLPSDSILIGGVFRLVPEKRPLLWIDCVWDIIKHSKNMYGVIIGEGRMRKEVESRISEIGAMNRIILCGFREDSATCYDSIRVTLLTSSNEGLPNVLIESQSRGTPVVTTDVGGAREALEDGTTGVLLKEDSIEEVGRAIIMILNDWNEKETSASCKQFISSKFSMERMAQKTSEVYTNLLSKI